MTAEAKQGYLAASFAIAGTICCANGALGIVTTFPDFEQACGL